MGYADTRTVLNLSDPYGDLSDQSELEPFGEENKTPLFAFKNLKIDSIRALSEGKHLKLTLKDNRNIVNAIGFNLGELSNDYRIGDKVEIKVVKASKEERTIDFEVIKKIEE